jgi:hypothetical protein
VLLGRDLCDGLITQPEESYRLRCVVVCDLEPSWMRRPWPSGGMLRQKHTNKQTVKENYTWWGGRKNTFVKHIYSIGVNLSPLLVYIIALRTYIYLKSSWTRTFDVRNKLWILMNWKVLLTPEIFLQ